MARIKLCGECGVPLAVGGEQTWHDNGVITQTADPDHRMLFHESENIDMLFEGIEKIIGAPIEHIVIESKRREVKEYVEKMVSPLARRVARSVGTDMMVARLSKTGRTYGYGDISLAGRRRKRDGGDYISMGVRKPHSLAYFCGETLGAWEAIDGRDHNVRYEKAGPDEYLVTVQVGTHPVELRERLQVKRYPVKPGGVALERCGTCGVPLEVARYRWNLPVGTITHPGTGSRMAIFGPAGVEAVLDDLESELGSTIPDVVVEAERLYIREAGKATDWAGSPASYGEMMAVRGLGNIVAFDAGDESVTITIENSCIALVTVGMVQGLFELARGIEHSRREWTVTPEGDLTITVRSG